MPADGESQVAGRVQAVNELDLEAASPGAAVRVEVLASGQGSGDALASAISASDGLFTLTGPSALEAEWLLVGRASASSGFYQTLQPGARGEAQSLALLVFRQSVLDSLAQTSFMNDPQQFDPSRAHLVVRFETNAGAPALGVSLVGLDGSPVLAAYDAGDIYSDAPLATDSRGTAVVVNLLSAALPGQTATLRYENADGQSAEASIALAGGAVTWVTLPEP